MNSLFIVKSMVQNIQFFKLPEVSVSVDMETNRSQQRPTPVVCRILCINVRGLSENLSGFSEFSVLLVLEVLCHLY